MAKKTYRVVGDSPIVWGDKAVTKDDDDPTFAAELTEGQEQALVEGGHIKVVEKPKGGK